METQVAAKYNEFFETISTILELIKDDLSYYYEYSTVLYQKWDKVQKVRVLTTGRFISLNPGNRLSATCTGTSSNYVPPCIERSSIRMGEIDVSTHTPNAFWIPSNKAFSAVGDVLKSPESLYRPV